MHRSWLVVAALTFVGCFNAGEEPKPDSGTDSVASTADGGRNCGNGVVDLSEQCEAMPLNLNGESCASATLGEAPEGPLGCNANCTFNVSRCTGLGGGGVGGNGGVGGVGGG